MKQRHIDVFRAVMTYGGISRAAEVLNVSQPAVSRTIAELETEVGFRLFDRQGRHSKPTPEAEQLKEEVDTYFAGLERVEAAAAEIRDLRRGHVRLATMPALTLSLTPRIVRSFLERNPTVKVTMDVHTSPRIVDQIAVGQFNLGLGQLPETRPEIDVIGTWRVACVCVLPKGHRLTVKRRIKPRDLDGEPLVALSHHTLASRHLAQSFLSADVKQVIRVESQPSYAACALAVEGVGIAVVDALTAQFFGSENVTTVPFAPYTPFDFRLIRPKNMARSMLAERFAEETVTIIDAHPLTERHR